MLLFSYGMRANSTFLLLDIGYVQVRYLLFSVKVRSEYCFLLMNNWSYEERIVFFRYPGHVEIYLLLKSIVRICFL